MKETLSTNDVMAVLEKMGTDVTAQAERLRELDAAIGDGDLGITVTIGFEAVHEALPALADADLGTVLMRSGMAFNRKAASTFGALFATMMMRAAKEAKGLSEVGLPEIAAMFAVAAEGVKERGKAQVGDKTLLDALVPAAEALGEAQAAGAPLAAALQQAARAAEQGARATVEMKSKIGRASWFSDRTQGVQDPGATAVALMVASLSDFVQNG
jgi:dihydroxyacetone kinase-like protein